MNPINFLRLILRQLLLAKEFTGQFLDIFSGCFGWDEVRP